MVRNVIVAILVICFVRDVQAEEPERSEPTPTSSCTCLKVEGGAVGPSYALYDAHCHYSVSMEDCQGDPYSECTVVYPKGLGPHSYCDGDGDPCHECIANSKRSVATTSDPESAESPDKREAGDEENEPLTPLGINQQCRFDPVSPFYTPPAITKHPEWGYREWTVVQRDFVKFHLPDKDGKPTEPERSAVLLILATKGHPELIYRGYEILHDEDDRTYPPITFREADLRPNGQVGGNTQDEKSGNGDSETEPNCGESGPYQLKDRKVDYPLCAWWLLKTDRENETVFERKAGLVYNASHVTFKTKRYVVMVRNDGGKDCSTCAKGGATTEQSDEASNLEPTPASKVVRK